MSIPYNQKINELLIPTPISGEVHIIGIVGIVTYAPGLIRLIEVPQGPAPAVTIPGYTEITSGSPTGTQFLVNYETGVITFSTGLDGTTVTVSYVGLGSEIAAEDVNELQEPLNSIANLTIAYNWPSPPTVTWSLASGIITNSNISGSALISLSKLQALNPDIVPITNGSGILVSSSTTTTELSYLDATSSIQTQLDSKQPVGGITLVGAVTTVFSDLSLNTASTFAVLGSTTVTNTGFTVLTGDLGLNPGTSVTGFPPGTYSGTEYIADSIASQAQTDATNAYNAFTALTGAIDLSGQVLGTGGTVPTLTPGIYKFSSSAQITGTLTLNAQGNPSAQWVFQIGSTLTTASSASVVITNGGTAGNVYWLCGSSATLGTSTSFQGTIIATTNVIADTSASIQGRLIALTGAVTLDDNAVSVIPGSGGIEVTALSPTAAVISIHADSSSDLMGNVQFVSGSNVSLSQVGQAITINVSEPAAGITQLTGDVTTSPSNPYLNTAATYAVLAETAVTNTGFTVLTGDLGISPNNATSITGFPPGTYSGTENAGNAAAAQALTDATSAAATLQALGPGTDLSSTNLGGYVAVPGVYSTTSTATWSAGPLTLNGTGTYIFLIGSSLTMPAGASVILENGATANNVYFVTGTTFTFGANCTVNGTILAGTSITFAANSVLNGRALLYGPSGTSVTFPSAATVTVPPGSGGVEVATIANGVITPSMITTLTSANFDFPNNVQVAGVLGVGTLTNVASALLELDSTTKGFLPPRMTTTQMNAISSPAEGLEIYATDTHQWMGYNGSAWVILG
jgi:hypothetical protein